MLIVSLVITIGFVFEIAPPSGSGALKINSRQDLQHKSQNKATQAISYLGSSQFENIILNKSRKSPK